MQAEYWDNVRPLNDLDVALGRALVEFGAMIERGMAITVAGAVSAPGPVDVEPFYRESDFPCGSVYGARVSIERARSQYFKGRMSEAECRSIVTRCETFIKDMTV